MFSYYEERATWLQDSEGTALALGPSRGVTVEKLDPLAYRVSYGKRASSLRSTTCHRSNPPTVRGLQ